MPSTINSATLTVTIQEELSLGGVQLGGTTIYTVGSINEFSRRIMTINAANQVILARFDATGVAAGVYDKDHIRYVRITNLDDTNYVNLLITNDGAVKGIAHKLGRGHSMIFNNYVFDEASSIAGISWKAIRDISAKANKAECDLEVVVGSV